MTKEEIGKHCNAHGYTDKEVGAFNDGMKLGRADAIDEYNSYRRKVIDIATIEDFKQLKRVATIDISENLIKELSQEDLLRVIFDEIVEQLKENKRGKK